MQLTIRKSWPAEIVAGKWYASNDFLTIHTGLVLTNPFHSAFSLYRPTLRLVVVRQRKGVKVAIRPVKVYVDPSHVDYMEKSST